MDDTKARLEPDEECTASFTNRIREVEARRGAQLLFTNKPIIATAVSTHVYYLFIYTII